MRLVLLLLGVPALVCAQTPLTFNDGLSLELPPGWDTTALVTAPPEHKMSSSPFEDTETLVTLLQARPADSARTARITVLRDSTWPAPVGPMVKRDVILKLNEFAMLQGYRPEKLSGKGGMQGNTFTVFGEVTAVAPDGRRRVFTCIAFKPGHEYSLRCFWEQDEMDVQSRQEQTAWMNSLATDGVKLADILAGTAAVAMRPPGNKPAANATPPSTRMVPPYMPDSITRSAPSATPLPVASPTPPPPEVVSAKVSELIEKNRNALVVIEGQNGRGSGFVCNLDGKPTALTNTHVLAGNPQPKFTTMDGTALQLAEAALGVDHDVCKLSAPGATTALELMTPADGVPKIGDPIAVLGNSEGAGVIKPLEGSIVGLGPNLIEVSAPFVPGNSGSPIIHVPTGKVIGIATYLTIRKVNEMDKSGVETEVRRFGYRLDSVKTWEPVNWAKFYAQASQVNKILSVGEEFAQFLTFLREKDRRMPAFGNTAVRRAVETFQSRVSNSRRMSAADMQASQREFLGNLRAATRADLVSFDSRTAYDYFRRQVAEETKFRDALYEAFTKALNERQ